MGSKAFKFIPHGAILQEFLVDGKNVVLGFNDKDEYLHNPCYFGATIGRIANRVSDAEIHSLNGKRYPLAANNGPCSLHGGYIGWDQHEWTHERSETVSVSDGNVVNGTKFVDVYSLVSGDGDEGYPGEVKCVVTYTQYKEKADRGIEKEILEVEYEAELVGGEGIEETAINLTNHSYFNIGPHPTIAGTIITIPTNSYLPTDSNNIPNAPIASYPGISPNTPFTLGPVTPVIDSCFILNPNPSTIPLDTRSLPLTTVSAYHPETNLHLEVATTEPAFQLYTGANIADEERKDGSPARSARAAFCVEPSRYVDAVNRAEWRGMTVVRRGQKYGSRIVYRGWKGAEK
ncbi:galactose mutarotase-like domain-containing protein [Kalaharituber pfeilii]|nr:galactose mutarotase-like domain-containing protein [Kalaharituber pfeilii]